MENALENWESPDCYKCVYSYREKPELNYECSSLRVILKDKLHMIQPVIRVTLDNVTLIRKLIPKSICSTEDVKEAVTSYAKVTKESQRKVIEEASTARSFCRKKLLSKVVYVS